MNTVHRRIEIINILIIRRHTTASELAQEFGVSVRTIQYDIQALSPVYPIYTKQGENGGIFIRDDYKPYVNSLSPIELQVLQELLEMTDGIHRKILIQIIRKYGPDNLKL
ncbi:MAG: HTH domain-containing protein [Alphaproteobacteria bacterium]|nr:HTH domain-containing protein [Alphaproteobacteria bacterium]